jgi:hypothetical protein
MVTGTEVIIGVIRSVRADPLRLGHHGNPVANQDRLRELLLRVARLGQAHGQVPRAGRYLSGQRLAQLGDSCQVCLAPTAPPPDQISPLPRKR